MFDASWFIAGGNFLRVDYVAVLLFFGFGLFLSPICWGAVIFSDICIRKYNDKAQEEKNNA